MFADLNITYRPGDKSDWKGRPTNPDLGAQYWCQAIQCEDIRGIGKDAFGFGIIGYACDEGVKRNLGRPGAKDGSRCLRAKLGGVPIHFENKKVVDFGDVICNGDDLESCQVAFSKSIATLISNNVFPIGIGGGHDMAFAHYRGLKNTFPDKRIGIINFDAHFDLRPVEHQPNSGTPFYQILQQYDNVDYFPIGIQKQSNTKELFEIAKKFNIDFMLHDELHSKTGIKQLHKKLRSISDNNDYLYVTIDMDGFASAYAPGVSAPSPLGFTPQFVFETLKVLLKSKKVMSFDIAELNPQFDRDTQTALLASRLVDFMVVNHFS
ncbi:formimidoylglutamase [Hyunsoonleella sp. SJ7]|uniref:Formimidoylglutamase n=1 Tax=Hyunsoonleella aquatilis TaxID=2762758 RepID=A0A923H869_9FLAO|nr:formimidoylglutamase [Hyunsoonleella aquatilis]MBC3758065.1 formimidoylglutamase [Hyunsoonleella aquatilis]